MSQKHSKDGFGCPCLLWMGILLIVIICQPVVYGGQEFPGHDGSGYLPSSGPAPLRFLPQPSTKTYHSEAMAKVLKTNDAKYAATSPSNSMPDEAAPKLVSSVVESKTSSGKESNNTVVLRAAKPTTIHINPVAPIQVQFSPPEETDYNDPTLNHGPVVSPQMLLKYFDKNGGNGTNNLSVITPLDIQPVSSPPTRDSRATLSTGP